jgi:hypothetical protein
MITVFNVATHDELMEMFSFEGEEYDKESLLKHHSPDSNNAELALLYATRGEMEKAEKYLTLIKNNEYRQEICQTIYEKTE